MNSTREIASHLAVVAVCLLGIPLFAQTAPQPELYALVVGVTKYDKAELNGLRFPEKDAQAVAKELHQQIDWHGVCSYSGRHVYDGLAGKRTWLRWQASK